MMHLNPLVLVGAVIGVITALLVAAYAAVKDKKTAMGFERNMEDGEIMRRLARYARPYLSKFLIVGVLMLFSIAYDIISPLIVGRIEELVQDFQYRISQQGLKLEQYLQYMGMTMEQFKEQFREQADKQVKMRLAMEAIVAKESIEATEEEFEAEIKRIADAYQMEADKVKSLVDAAAVKKDLAVNKAIDFVKSKANIVAGAAEEKKPAKKTTRKTTKKAAAKQDEEPKEEETKGE